jgi:hypothetical protein
MPNALPHLTQNGPRPNLAVAIEPVAAILNAFKSHPVIGLSEGDHGNEEGVAFRRSLTRDPRLARLVNEIVVESGNSWCPVVSC